MLPKIDTEFTLITALFSEVIQKHLFLFLGKLGLILKTNKSKKKINYIILTLAFFFFFYYFHFGIIYMSFNKEEKHFFCRKRKSIGILSHMSITEQKDITSAFCFSKSLGIKLMKSV